MIHIVLVGGPMDGAEHLAPDDVTGLEVWEQLPPAGARVCGMYTLDADEPISIPQRLHWTFA